MKLEAPVNNLIPQIISLYEQKISLWQQFGDGCAQFIAAPKPNVDYGQIAAEFPKINAKLEYVDQTLFSATPLVFAALIDQRPDSENHLSHLLITKVQRDTLVGQLTLAFGQKLDQQNQNYTVSAASVLKGYLTKDYKCSDEP